MEKIYALNFMVVMLALSVSVYAENIQKAKELHEAHSLSKPDAPMVAPKSLSTSTSEPQPLVRKKVSASSEGAVYQVPLEQSKSVTKSKVAEKWDVEIDLKPDVVNKAPKQLAPLIDEVQQLSPPIKRDQPSKETAPMLEDQPKKLSVSKSLETSEKKSVPQAPEILTPKEITQGIFNKLVEHEKQKPENIKKYEEIEKLKTDGHAAIVINKKQAELDRKLENKVENSLLFKNALEQQTRLEQEASAKNKQSSIKESEKSSQEPAKISRKLSLSEKDQKTFDKKINEMQQSLDKAKEKRLAVIDKNAALTDKMRNQQKEAVEKSFAEKTERLKKQAENNPQEILNKKSSTYLSNFEGKQSHDQKKLQSESVKEENKTKLSELKDLKLETSGQTAQLKKEVAKLERAAKLLEKRFKIKQNSPTLSEASKTDWYLKEQQKLSRRVEALLDRANLEPESFNKKKSRMSRVKSIFKRK